MSRYFYRLRMCSYAEALVRCSKRETLQRIRLQYNLMQLGNELVCSDLAFGAAGQPLERGSKLIETVPCALDSMAGPIYNRRTTWLDHCTRARDVAARGLGKCAALEPDSVAVSSHAAVDHCFDAHPLSNPARGHPFVWSTVPMTA